VGSRLKNGNMVEPNMRLVEVYMGFGKESLRAFIAS